MIQGGGYRMARGWRYTSKASSLASAPLFITRVRVCAMHPFYFMGSLRVSIHQESYLSFLAFVFILLLFVFIFSLFVIFTLFLLSISRWSFLNTCSSDIFPVQQTRTGLATMYIVILCMFEVLNVNAKNANQTGRRAKPSSRDQKPWGERRQELEDTKTDRGREEAEERWTRLKLHLG